MCHVGEVRTHSKPKNKPLSVRVGDGPHYARDRVWQRASGRGGRTEEDYVTFEERAVFAFDGSGAQGGERSGGVCKRVYGIDDDATDTDRNCEL